MRPEEQVESMVGISPVVLTAAVTLAQGATAQPDMDKLTSPFRSPMLVDEIRFMLRSADTAGLATFVFAGAVKVALKMGRFAITDVPTPIWNFGPYGDEDTASQQSTDLYAASSTNRIEFYRWVLPKPLFLRPGESIIPQVSRAADATSISTKLWITYAGRLLAPGTPTPRELYVPHVDYWAPLNTVDAPNSNQIFANPYRSPLKIQRFVGHLQQTFGSVSGGDDIGISSGLDNAGANDGTEVQAKISDSTGYNVVRDFMPFGTLFQLSRRAFTVQRTLDPREGMKVQLRNVIAPLGSGSINPQISMIGYRAERLDD